MNTRGYCQDRLKSGSTVPPSHHGHDLEHWPLRDALMFSALADAVPLARAHLRQLLSGWGRPELSPDAGVVVSELVTNAVASSAGLGLPAAPVLVWLGSDGHCLLLAVADVSPRPPVRLDVRPDAEGGRGLALVEALSARWGWHPAIIAGLKKVVWAEWRLAEEDHAGPPERGRVRTSRAFRGSARMTSLPTSCAAARIAAFLDGHPSWSAWWDKHAGLWRVAEDDIDSDLHAESPDADVVIQYMQAHSRDTRCPRT